MSQINENAAESRKHSRLPLPAMYTLVRVKPRGADRFCWTGHIYDVSLTGMRFELDEPIDPGTVVEIRAMLPGANHVAFNATGIIVRFHDDENDFGPMRMGMMFEEFHHEEDRESLTYYIDQASTRIAA